MKKTIKKLELEVGKIRQEINRLEEEDFNKIQAPFLKSLVGKCFVYRNNNYGGGNPKWDEFRKIIDIITNKEGSLIFICKNISIDGNGNAKIETSSNFTYSNRNWWGKVPFTGYDYCDEKEFEKEYSKTINELGNQKILKRILSK